MDFYKGRVLRIDLSAGTTAVEPLNMEWAEKYLGGKGLLLRYLWEEVEPKMDPWSPQAPLILMTGPFAGTTVSTASRLVVGCKSPITGILNDSYVGGSFAPELKFAGYDAVIIKGKAAEPTIVVIKDDVVEFMPAAKYWGMKTSEIEEAMRRDVDKDAKTLSIGPAGEHKVAFACISTDQYHKAGRAGHGALMGDKNLKAVVVRGTGSVPVGDAKAFLDLLYKMHTDFVLTEDNLWAHEEGTPTLVDVVNGGGALPTRNWSAGQFEGAEKINSESFQKIRLKKRACFQCSIGCRNFHGTTFAGKEVRGEGPEYETIALCGANCGIDDIDALMKFNELCDEFGLDTISAGTRRRRWRWTSPRRAIADLGLHFGEVDGIRRGARADLQARGHRRRARQRRQGAGRQVRTSRARHPGQGTGGAGLRPARLVRQRHQLRDQRPGRLPHAVLPAGRRARRRHAAGRYDGGQGRARRRRQRAERLHRAELQLDQVQRHLVRLLGRHPRAARHHVPAGARARRHRGRGHDDGRAHLEPRPSLQPARGRGEGRPAEEAVRGRATPKAPPPARWWATTSSTSRSQKYYALRGWDENGVPSEAKLAELGVDVRL